MGRKVIYQQATGWVTIHLSPYHAWQGHISDVPDVPLKYIMEVYLEEIEEYIRNSRDNSNFSNIKLGKNTANDFFIWGL